MKSGYDQFFQKARKLATEQQAPQGRIKIQKKSSAVHGQFDLSSESAEQEIRRRMKMSPQKRKKKTSIPWKMMGISFVGLVIAIWGFYNYEYVENIVKNIEIQVTGEAYAEAAKTAVPSSKTSEKGQQNGEDENGNVSQNATATANGEAGVASGTASSLRSSESSELDHLQKLNERKKELDAREEELNRMESELQVQKVELEKRLKELEEMRTKISSILEDRVKVDEQKVDTLVQMYTNMKAPQAAKVFETMDEDLAIEILGRMKKKNAADIMNLLKPEKAQILSEMFAGYKRRSPASK